MTASDQSPTIAAPAHGRHIVFTHIPKTAGHTVRQSLFEANGYVKDQVLYATGASGWLKLRAEIRSRKGERLLITGHGAAFGIHSVLGIEADYVTVVRHPVTMVTSYYNFVRQWDRNSGNALAREAHDLSLTGFAAHPKVRNRQSRMLAGIFHTRWLGETRLYHQLVRPSQRAIHNLRHHFTAYATLEQLADGLPIMAERLGFPPLEGPLPVANRGRNPAPVELDTGTKGVLTDILQEDMKTWEWATENYRLPPIAPSSRGS